MWPWQEGRGTGLARARWHLQGPAGGAVNVQNGGELERWWEGGIITDTLIYKIILELNAYCSTGGNEMQAASSYSPKGSRASVGRDPWPGRDAGRSAGGEHGCGCAPLSALTGQVSARCSSAFGRGSFSVAC